MPSPDCFTTSDVVRAQRDRGDVEHLTPKIPVPQITADPQSPGPCSPEAREVNPTTQEAAPAADRQQSAGTGGGSRATGSHPGGRRHSYAARGGRR